MASEGLSSLAAKQPIETRAAKQRAETTTNERSHNLLTGSISAFGVVKVLSPFNMKGIVLKMKTHWLTLDRRRGKNFLSNDIQHAMFPNIQNCLA